MAGSLAFTESTLTIASGSVTATRSNHVLAAESGTADAIANIATGSVSDGAFLIIRPDAGDTITVTDAATGAGEIHTATNADVILSGDHSITIQRRGVDWYEFPARPDIPDYEFIGTTPILAQATMTVLTNGDIDHPFAAGYDYIISLEAFAPTSDGQIPWLRLSDDDSTFEAGASDYEYSVKNSQGTGTTWATSTGAAQTALTESVTGNDSGATNALEVTIINPGGTSEKATYKWDGHVKDTGGTPALFEVKGNAVFNQGTEAVLGIQFLWSGGSTFKAQGDMSVWRRKRS